MDRPGMAVSTDSLQAGDIWWAEISPTEGREQSGRRPVVVVATEEYLSLVDTLAIVVPVTTTDRGWPNHVRFTIPTPQETTCFAMTEQVRAIARTRLVAPIGHVDPAILQSLRDWIHDFLTEGP